MLLETDEANDGDPDAAGAPERKAALLVAVAEEKGYHEQDEHYGAEREDVEIRRFGEGFKGGEEIEGIVAVNLTAGRSRGVHVKMLNRSASQVEGLFPTRPFLATQKIDN